MSVCVRVRVGVGAAARAYALARVALHIEHIVCCLSGSIFFDVISETTQFLGRRY